MSTPERLYDGAYPDEVLQDAAAIRARLGGVGELLPLESIANAWGAYSGALDASWLIVADNTMENFTGWLLGEWLHGGEPRTP